MKLLLISAAVLACTFAAPQGGFEDEGQVVGEGSPKVSYNYYLHNTPEEEEIDRVVPKFITPTNLKRNKVIFVKVPPFDPNPQGPIELPARIIDKTIIYVLVKKEKDPEQIKITTETPEAPEAPTVHVVKYDNEKELDNKIVQGVYSSKLYGKTTFTEDDVNIQLNKVKEVTDLKFITSSGRADSPGRIPQVASTSGNSQTNDQGSDAENLGAE